jgi:hypothetical protein
VGWSMVTLKVFDAALATAIATVAKDNSSFFMCNSFGFV